MAEDWGADPSPVQRLAPGLVTLSGEVLEEVVAALARDIRRTRDGGGRVSDPLARAFPVLHRERRSVREARAGAALAAAEPPDPSETMTLAEAEAVLPLSDRQIRRVASTRYAGRKWLGAWVLDRALVEADVRQRPSDDVRR
jgi:hypothetical protein